MSKGQMFRFSKLSELPEDFAATVVTIGKFDGVHLGHQSLIAKTVAIAEEHNLAAMALTFDRHPSALLNPAEYKLPLIGTSQKLDLFEDFGLDAALVMPFDKNLADLAPESFVEMILVDGLQAKAVVVGEDFRYGQGGRGDIATLQLAGQHHGFSVFVVPSIEVSGRKVSSSLIRDLLDQGDVKQVAKLLGRLHSTKGMVEHGLKIGRELGFPTANLSRESEGYLPLDAVYAGWLHSEGERYPAALSVGINETLQAVPRLVEAHVIGRKDLDLYDKVVEIEYVDFVRPAAKFNGMDELIAAIEHDLSVIMGILTDK